MSRLFLRLCECRLYYIFSISRSFVRPETGPDLTRKHSSGTKQNKTKNEKKNEQVKAKN